MKKNNRTKTNNIRINIIFWFIGFIGIILVINLFYIQVKNGAEFRAQADGQYTSSSGSVFKRGSIFFEQKDGSRISAASLKSGYKIAVNPQTLKDPNRVYTELSEYIKMDKETFFKKTADTEKTYLEIAHTVEKETGETFKQTLGKDIQLYQQFWRVYPLQTSAAHVLGFLAYNQDEYAGRYGLESSYEAILRRANVDVYKNFFARIFHDVQNFVAEDYQPEGDIVAGIDPQVQLFFEKQLASVEEKWGSQSVGGIIMDPKTGQIYAMGSYPNFNNNDFSDGNTALFKNPLVENSYEMGSIMKPLVAAIALDNGFITAATGYYDKGFVQVEKHTVSNFDKKGRGWVTMQDVLNQSLNTGMVFIAEKIPKNIFRDYFKKYGFGEKTGIDLPNEAMGLTSNLKSNRDIEFANMAFGQGLAISPIVMIKALSVMANDGKTVTPHIVKKIEYTNGFSKELDYTENQIQVLKPETADEITRMLVNVFDEYQNGSLKLEHHSVAAKTGTAQIPNPQGGYYDDRNLHSFFGYFPAYDPEFIIFLYTVHPKNIKYASQTLISPFKETANFLINYYAIPPDR
jgi:stage V sporulation protein D (sporulation-specific penicillin-binding protein)